MKRLSMIILSLAVMTGFAISHNLYAAEPSQAAAEHLAMAKSYDEKAAALDKVIAEHEQMKKDYGKYFVNDKVTPQLKLNKGMTEHCDAIIKDNQKLKVEYLDFAKWHTTMAKELQEK